MFQESSFIVAPASPAPASEVPFFTQMSHSVKVTDLRPATPQQTCTAVPTVWAPDIVRPQPFILFPIHCLLLSTKGPGQWLHAVQSYLLNLHLVPLAINSELWKVCNIRVALKSLQLLAITPNIKMNEARKSKGCCDKITHRFTQLPHKQTFKPCCCFY